MLRNSKRMNVKEGSNGTAGRPVRTGATLHVLYRKEPGPGEPFIEIRRWETQNGHTAELVAEYGIVADGDLNTVAYVVPFHWSADRALRWLRGQMVNDALGLGR